MTNPTPLAAENRAEKLTYCDDCNRVSFTKVCRKCAYKRRRLAAAERFCRMHYYAAGELGYLNSISANTAAEAWKAWKKLHDGQRKGKKA